MKITNDLTKEQWDLAQYLEDMYSEDPTLFISKEMICKNFPETYDRENEISDEHSSSAFNRIRRDIRAIKNCVDFQHVLISNHKGYKIANKQEAEMFCEREIRRAKRILTTNSLQQKRIKNDGQCSLNTSEENELLKAIDTYCTVKKSITTQKEGI